MESSATIVEKRKEQLNSFYESGLGPLVSFVSRLGINPAHEVLNHPDAFLPLISSAVDKLEIEDDQDRVFLLSRLAFYIGTYFASTLQGVWKVENRPESKYFSRYVVGDFAGGTRGTVIDPFEMADKFIASMKERTLSDFIAEISNEYNRSFA